MKKNRDLNEIAEIEKALSEQYGKEAIVNPKSAWTEEKEQEYLKSLQKFYKNKKQDDKIEELEGYTVRVSSAKMSQEVESCSTCAKLSFLFDQSDQLCFNRYGCCFSCYIQYVDGREERWNSGWRPNS